MQEIIDFFNNFFYVDNFPPRWKCGIWSEFHGWLYILSDIAIWAAYFTIPFLLIHFIRRKKDIPFSRIFWLFGLFILACGTTHLIDAIIFWVPIYRVSAFVRLLTAIVSWATIYTLYKILPDALSLKSPAELERQVSDRTRELNVSVQNMKFLADAMPQIVWTAKPDGTRDYFNQRALLYTGKSVDELSGWKWTDIIHPEDRQKTLKAWELSINDETLFQIESRLLSHDGNYYWHLTRALPSKDENDNIILWVGTATEIEHHKRSEEILENKVASRTEELRMVNAELAQSNADLDHFASVASHDLQAPLRTVTRYLDIILERNKDLLDEQTVGHITKAMNASNRMRNLIQNLLSYAQVNAKKAEMAEIALDDVVQSVLSGIEELKNKSGAQINVKPLPTVFADEVQMGQLFQNLISNAIIYNGSFPPIITVDYTENPQEYIIRVADNGIGITKENQIKIFDVFTRLQSDVQGTGLGLSISKRIVDKHRGRIWVESEEGQGTSFFFTIPK